MTDSEHDLAEENPATGKITSRRVFTGRVISLDVDTVRFPNGTTGELEMIRHSGASAIVPLLRMPSGETAILLIRQYRYAAEGFVYEIPAGRLEKGESPEDCAHRELKEETGYTAGQMTSLTTIFTTPGFTDERIDLFLARDLVAGTSALEVDEILDLHPVPPGEAMQMIRSGQIQDGKTIVGLLFAASFEKLE